MTQPNTSCLDSSCQAVYTSHGKLLSGHQQVPLVQEIFEECGRAADAEAEFMAPVLIKWAGSGTNALPGRNNFASEADAALITMVQTISANRVSLGRWT